MINNISIAARIFLGLIFSVFGLNGIFNFMQAPSLSFKGTLFIQALMHTGYLWGSLKVIEVLCGLFLLAGVFIPLSLAILAPVILNIVLFHIFLDPKGIPMSFTIFFMELFLIWRFRRYFKGLLSMRTES
jgi:uncharacterized membrane protein YphA (DoxX/SURF4 family)